MSCGVSQAASLFLQVNIAIYQAGQPRWCITNFPTGEHQGQPAHPLGGIGREKSGRE
jgi:hypothetical protein